MATNRNAGHIAGIPGVVTTFSIDPTKLTVHMRNKVIRSLRAGYIDGGYASNAANLTRLLVGAFGVTGVQWSWNGLSIPPDLDREAVEKIAELRNADWVAFTLENPAGATMTNRYYVVRYQNEMNALRTGDRCQILLMDAKRRYQVALIVTNATRSEETARLVQQAIDAISGTELIPVNPHATL